jgi:hypothetical protein
MLTVTYAECHIQAPNANIFILNVIMLSVVMLIVVAPHRNLSGDGFNLRRQHILSAPPESVPCLILRLRL